jgi:hypothetical protein
MISVYLAAVSLGAVHAFEADHMVAVTALVARRPGVSTAVSHGIRWGLGHALVVFVAGLAIVWTGVVVPPAAAPFSELAVGVALVLLGCWTGLQAKRDRRGVDTRATTVMGAVHGLAGTAPLVALLPMTMLEGTGAVTGYFMAFGVGSVLAMAGYAALAATAMARAAASRRGGRIMALAAAAASTFVGAWWIVGAAASF